MTKYTALRIAIALLEREQRIKRQPYELYRQGFTSHKASHDRYLELIEAIKALKTILYEI